MDRKSVSPVIAIVLLLMMTVAAAGAAYFWLTTMQSSMQESSRKSIENIMEASGRRVTAQATLCKPTYPYEGLKGYWTIDDYNSTGVLDVSGNNNFGTFEGTAFGTDNITGGQVGKALEFDGSDDYIEVPDDPSLDITDAITISVWIKPRIEYNDSIRTVFVNKRQYEYILYYDGGQVRFYQEDVSDSFNGYETDLAPDTWYHVVGTYSKETNTRRIYVSGELKAEESATGEIGTGGTLQIGTDGNDYFHGTIDDVRIYNRALSADEIKELYDAENHSARRRIDVTVRNIGSEDIPKATWVANLKHDGTNVETDAYNASAIDTGELSTLKFYFKDFKPNTEYTIELQGTGTSTTVSC